MITACPSASKLRSQDRTWRLDATSARITRNDWLNRSNRGICTYGLNIAFVESMDQERQDAAACRCSIGGRATEREGRGQQHGPHACGVCGLHLLGPLYCAVGWKWGWRAFEKVWKYRRMRRPRFEWSPNQAIRGMRSTSGTATLPGLNLHLLVAGLGIDPPHSFPTSLSTLPRCGRRLRRRRRGSWCARLPTPPHPVPFPLPLLPLSPPWLISAFLLGLECLLARLVLTKRRTRSDII
jgi:hypothetical protein